VIRSVQAPVLAVTSLEIQDGAQDTWFDTCPGRGANFSRFLKQYAFRGYVGATGPSARPPGSARAAMAAHAKAEAERPRARPRIATESMLLAVGCYNNPDAS